MNNEEINEISEEDGKFFFDEERLLKIKKERNKLRRLVKDLDKETKVISYPLIDNIAFCVIQLEELRELIKRDGYYEVYKNGEFQQGLKKSIASDLIIQVGKNYNMYLKQFREMLPGGVGDGDQFEKWKKENTI